MGKRRRAAIAFALLAALASPAERVDAHGAAPEATGLLAVAREQATLVRLSRGLAHRAADGFRFICPEAWGGDVTAPTAGLSDGAALVAAERLFIVESDGRVSAHPIALGMGVALVSHGDGAYGIFQQQGQGELRRITRTTNDLVRSLDEPFRALAASDSALWMLGWAGKTLVLQSILLSGEPGQRVTWSAPSVVARAELRAVSDQLYVSIWGSAAPWVTLGRVTEHGYELMVDGQSDIAGPVALNSGMHAAIDGTLERLDQRLPIGERVHLNCLESHRALAYACAHGDLTRVEPAGLGGVLFALSWLREPDYVGLDEVQRADCKVRWLDLRDHAEEAARSNAAPDLGGLEAGPANPANVETSDAGSRDAEPELAGTGASGCALGALGAPGLSSNLGFLCLLAALRRWGRSSRVGAKAAPWRRSRAI